MESFKNNTKTIIRTVTLFFTNIWKGAYAQTGKLFLFFRSKVSKTEGSISPEESTYQGSSPQGDFGEGMPENKKNKNVLLIGSIVFVIVLLIVAIGLSFFYFTNNKEGKEGKETVFSIIKQGTFVGTLDVGGKVMFGDLEMTIYRMYEDSYRPLELDAEGNRAVEGYLGIQIMIFNRSHNKKDVLLFGLTDDKGNQYERDPEIAFYLDGVKDFGPAKEIYPSTIREGYLLFPAPAAEAKKLQLVVFSETRNENIIFEIER